MCRIIAKDDSRRKGSLVVGAGIGGLGAATALRQNGCDVDVIEEVRPEVTVYAVGINQPANSLRALRKLGVLQEILEARYEFDHWTFYDHRGGLVVDVPSRLGDEAVPANCALPRKDLHRALIGAAEDVGVKVKYGVTVAGLHEDTADGVEVEFSEGSTSRYDLVVAFDGIKSRMRSQLFGNQYEPVTREMQFGA